MTKSVKKEQWQIELDKVPYKSVLYRYKNIEKRNIAFNKLNAETMRKEIAYDALQLTLTQRLIPSDGCYWGYKLVEIKNDGKIRTAKVFQERLLNLPQNCEVCARGAMMVSQIRLGNELHACNDNVAKGDESNIKGFSMVSFTNMEKYYEYRKESTFNDTTRLSYGEMYYALERRKYRLINIFLNVLTNGDFNDNVEIDYIQKYNLDLSLFIENTSIQDAIKKVWENNPIK